MAKIGTSLADPLFLLVLRYALVLVVLSPLALWLRPAWPRRPAEWLHTAMVGVLIQTVYFGLCYVAFALGTSAGTVALIVSLQPVLVALAAPALVGERVGGRQWAGFALGLAGALIVILSRATIETVSTAGVLLSVGALLGMSGGTLYEKRFGGGLHPLVANIIQYAAGLATTLPLALVFGRPQFTVGIELAAVLAYLVIGNSLIAISLLLWMIRRGGAARVSALFYLVPPGAALLSWLLLDEHMPALAWLGIAVAALGVALVQKRPAAAAAVPSTLRQPLPATGKTG
jgi:drug/metabolite transporter (DMT)-like permease